MEARDLIRLPDPRRNIEADVREALLDLHGKPHLFLRVKLTGWRFPHRAREPFLAIGDVVSRIVRIAPDELSASAYFDRSLPRAERLSFGYGKIIAWDFDLSLGGEQLAQLERLDRARLPKGVVDPFQKK